MSNTVLALHGFTQNGLGFRSALGGLAARLPRDVELVCLDAPHACSEGAVEIRPAHARSLGVAWSSHRADARRRRGPDLAFIERHGVSSKG